MEIFIMIYLNTTGDLYHSVSLTNKHIGLLWFLFRFFTASLPQGGYKSKLTYLGLPGPLNTSTQLIVSKNNCPLYFYRIFIQIDFCPGLVWSTTVLSCEMVKTCNDGVWYFSIKPRLTTLLVQPNRYFYFNLN